MNNFTKSICNVFEEFLKEFHNNGSLSGFKVCLSEDLPIDNNNVDDNYVPVCSIDISDTIGNNIVVASDIVGYFKTNYEHHNKCDNEDLGYWIGNTCKITLYVKY